MHQNPRIHAFLEGLDSLTEHLRSQRIALLVGGDSEEREASLHTGAAVAEELEAHGITPHSIDPAETDLAAALAGTDLVLSCLHGGAGEDGRIAAILDRLGIPYAFSGTAASSIAMHKPFFKAVVRDLGLLTPPSGENAVSPTGRYIHKRRDGGGSIGMEVDDRPTTDKPGYFTEAFVEGRSLSVGVLECDGDIIPLPAVEILLNAKEYYDEQSKYEDGFARVVPYAGDHADAIAEQAVLLMRTIGLRGAARFDIIETPRGELFFLEANGIPGMYPSSNLVTCAALGGMSFFGLLAWLLDAARHDGARV